MHTLETVQPIAKYCSYFPDARADQLRTEDNLTLEQTLKDKNWCELVDANELYV